jgi:hypothetical protein
MLKNCTFLSMYKQPVYSIDTSLQYAYKAKVFGYIDSREANTINGLTNLGANAVRDEDRPQRAGAPLRTFRKAQ